MTIVVSFYSYKGGVGRSLTQANVAALLAHRGLAVGCIDLDLDAGGLHTIFNVKRSDINRNLLDLLTESKIHDVGRATIDLTNRLTNPAPSGKLLLLPTVTEADKLDQISEDIDSLKSNLGAIIKQFNEEYLPHVVLLDSRSGFADYAATAIRLSDLIVCVMRPNRQNADGLKLFLDIQATRHDSPEIFLVLSQVPDSLRADKYIENLTGLIGRSFGARIPYDPDMALEESVVAATDPNSTRAKKYQPIADWIARHIE
jgi:septum site-determining protein MinD